VLRSSLVLCCAGCAADLHDVLVWLVGCPPKAQGMSSWKKCGMSVVNVRRTSSKKAARAGAAVAHTNVNTMIG